MYYKIKCGILDTMDTLPPCILVVFYINELWNVCARSSISSSGDPSLGSLFAARRGNGTNRLSSKLDTSSGFQKSYSSDAMIAGALKSFWYV